MVFLLAPDTKPMDFFPLSDVLLSFKTHVYFIGEKLLIIPPAYIVANEAKEYRGAMWTFFGLCCFDLVDYLVSYGHLWNLLGTPVSFNVVKITMACVVITITFIQWMRQRI